MINRPDGPMCPFSIKVSGPDSPSWRRCNCIHQGQLGQPTSDIRNQFGSENLPVEKRKKRMRRALKFFRSLFDRASLPGCSN